MRHCTSTGQPRHTSFARCSRSDRARPRSPSGEKNAAESKPLQLARICQSQRSALGPGNRCGSCTIVSHRRTNPLRNRHLGKVPGNTSTNHVVTTGAKCVSSLFITLGSAVCDRNSLLSHRIRRRSHTDPDAAVVGFPRTQCRLLRPAGRHRVNGWAGLCVCFGGEGGEDVVDAVAGVAEEHVGVVAEEQGVLYAGVAGGHGAFEYDDVVGVPDGEYGHAGDG